MNALSQQPECFHHRNEPVKLDGHCSLFGELFRE